MLSYESEHRTTVLKQMFVVTCNDTMVNSETYRFSKDASKCLNQTETERFLDDII